MVTLCAQLPADWPTDLPVPDNYARACDDDHEHLPTTWVIGPGVTGHQCLGYNRALSAEELTAVESYLWAGDG